MLKTKEEIEKYMERFGGMDDWTINDKGEVDVPGNIKLQRSFFPEGKFPFQFGTVKGSFDCSNASLNSLIGSPHTIEGDFDCKDNLLKSLTGAPITVQGFECQRNPLASLGNIETQIKKIFIGPYLPEFPHATPNIYSSLNTLANRINTISAEDFNAKVLELKRIREEKALFESSIAKVLDTPPLGEPTNQAAEPQLQQRAKPKFKL